MVAYFTLGALERLFAWDEEREDPFPYRALGAVVRLKRLDQLASDIVDRLVVVKHAFARIADVPGLLADDDRDDVGLLADAESRTMPGAEALVRNLQGRAEGKDYTGGLDPVSG